MAVFTFPCLTFSRSINYIPAVLAKFSIIFYCLLMVFMILFCVNVILVNCMEEQSEKTIQPFLDTIHLITLKYS